MRVEHRPGRIQLDGHGDQHQHRRQQDQGDRPAHQVHRPLERKFPATQGHVPHAEQRQATQIADAQLGGNDLKQIGKDLDPHLAPLAAGNDGQQFLVAQIGPADDHLLDFVLLDQGWEFIHPAQHRHAHDLPARFRVAIDKAHHLVAQAGHLAHLLQDHPAHIARAYNQQPVAPETPPPEPVAHHHPERTADHHQHDRQQPGIDDHHPWKVQFQRAILEQERGQRDGHHRANRSRRKHAVELVQARHGALDIVQA